MITPTRKAPNLVLPTVYHSEFNLFNEEPVNFTMVIFIRGLHCPLCITLSQTDDEICTNFKKYWSRLCNCFLR